jgi:hypothetical protein
MGYLKRPVRRKTARAEKLAHWDAARGIDPSDWKPCDDLRHIQFNTFLRFIVHDTEHDGWIGLFQGSWQLEPERDDSLPDSVRSRLRTVLRWFNSNLTVPKRVPPRAVFWFRSDAKACIESLRELIEIFRVAGHDVLMQATREPGRIVYQDEHQIATVRHASSRVTSSKW